MEGPRRLRGPILDGLFVGCVAGMLLIFLPLEPGAAGVQRLSAGTAAVLLWAAAVEEGLKVAGVVLVRLRDERPWPAERWVLTGAAAGVGFALVENALFALTFGLQAPRVGALLLITRSLVGLPTHALMIGIAAAGGFVLAERRARRGWGLVALAVLLHAGINASLLVGGGP